MATQQDSLSATLFGTVTFLFTDIVNSTRLWEQAPITMVNAMLRHDALIERCVGRFNGILVRPRGEGDSRFAVFAHASDAVGAAAAIQQAFTTECWETPQPIRVRMALHTGEAFVHQDYYGSAVNRCARLRSLAYASQILLSEATFELARDHWPEGIQFRHLGVHRLKDLERPETIYQLVIDGCPSDFPPPPSIDVHPHNLPIQLTSFLGRTQDIEAVCHLMRASGVRLVTLLGPGGIGKTRLALQLGAELLEIYMHGVFFVDLAPLNDPAMVGHALVQTLGLQEQHGQTMMERVLSYLRDKHMLLVLDNFEHLTTAAGLVHELLVHTQHVRILVTSRVPLHIRGEQEFLVPPLDLSLREDEAHIVDSPAVQLFIERAYAVNRTFKLTANNISAIQAICQHLEGMPLAIELAAARTRLFSPQALLLRLRSQSLNILSGGAYDLPPRQQTIRDTIAWSYNLLSEQEQNIFVRIGIFVGGCTLEAISYVCALAEEREEHIVAIVTTLLEANLLRRDDRATDMLLDPRVYMLETVREFAIEQLIGRGERAILQERHSQYYLTLAQEADSFIHTSDILTWLERLEREHDNYRAALRWCWDAEPHYQQGLLLAAHLWRFWYFHSHYSEGRAWLAKAINYAEQSGQDSAELAWIYLGDGLLISAYANNAAMIQERGEQSLRYYRRHHQPAWIASALLLFGFASIEQQKFDDALRYYEEALVYSRQSGDMFITTILINNILNMYLEKGQAERAWSMTQELQELALRLKHPYLLAIAFHAIATQATDLAAKQHALSQELHYNRLLGKRSDIAYTLTALGTVSLERKELLQALAAFEEGLALFEDVGDTLRSAAGYWNIAMCHLLGTSPEQARVPLHKCFVLSREAAHTQLLSYGLMGIACSIISTNHRNAAIKFCAVALQLWPIERWETIEHDMLNRLIDALQSRLDPESFQQAWEASAELKPDDVFLEALTYLS